MKRILYIAMLILMFLSITPIASASESTARFNSVFHTGTSLVISPSGRAQCEITVALMDKLQEGTITMELCIKEGNGWREIKSWEEQYDENDERTLSMSKTYYVYEEGKYILFGTVDVTTGLGSDYISVESPRTDYP